MSPRSRKPVFPKLPRGPGIGEQLLPTLESLEPILNHAEAKGSEYEWLKPEYHGINTSQFADLPVSERKRIERFFTTEGLMKALYSEHFAYPSMMKFYESRNGSEQTWLMVRPQEAFHLGRDPALLGDEVAQSALQEERSLEYPFETAPAQHERWRVINAYMHQRVRPKRVAVEALYDTMRLRDSNGRRVTNENRLDLAITVRTEVLHPFVDMVADVQRWDERDEGLRDKVHSVLDIKLFLDGNLIERKGFWRLMLRETGDYLEKVEEIFNRQTLFAKKQPNHPALQGVTKAVMAAEAGSV